jgi:hypothetical protein
VVEIWRGGNISKFRNFSRHCGRVLCKKCSEKELPILKFNIQKPVRSCDICFDVLTVGADQNLYK